MPARAWIASLLPLFPNPHPPTLFRPSPTQVARPRTPDASALLPSTEEPAPLAERSLRPLNRLAQQRLDRERRVVIARFDHDSMNEPGETEGWCVQRSHRRAAVAAA